MIHLIMGGQYGSEGKGAFTAWLTDPLRQNLNSILVIRTGGPNAGHSMRYQEETYKMRHIPCAWHNTRAKLALGPGAVVDPEYLLGTEIPQLEKIGVSLRGRFFIDPMCAIIEPKHKGREGPYAGTREGVGGATADRIMRTGKLAKDIPQLHPYLGEVSDLANDCVNQDTPVVIESSQGYALSLTRSGHYPYATSRDITPGVIMNDAGVPFRPDRMFTIMVLRTYPIRVAGESGPLAFEMSWEKLSEKTDGYIQPERTTVTQRIRRVGNWDGEAAKRAVRACCPNFIALTFFDYWRPDLAGKTQLDPDAYHRIEKVEKELDTPVVWVSTGFQVITAIKGVI